MTIEGGPGWQLEDVPADAIGVADGPERAPVLPPRAAALLARRAPLLAVVVAAAVGFGSATLLADWRTDTLGESDARTLSLEVTPVADGGDGGFGRDRDGRLVRTVPLTVRNTGPREIALDRVWLDGTEWRSEDASGRRLAPRGRARVVLLRPIDCDRLPEPARDGPGPAPSAVVRAVTDAGVREHRATAVVDAWTLSGEPDRRACGVLPAEEAVVSQELGERVVGQGVDVGVQLGNASRYDVEVTGVTVPAGTAVQVLDEAGLAPLPLPLRLPAGQFAGPREPFQEELRWLPVTLRLTVLDCALLSPTRSVLDRGRAHIGLDVASELGSGATDLLDGEGLLYRLRSERC